jgi:hypothetical protein
MALHYNPRIELSGLQLYVEAADPGCYPGSGQRVNDLSLNGRALSSNMSESYLNGKVFDFSPDYSSYINIEHNFRELDDLTMEVLFMVTGNHDNYHGTLISSGNWNVEHWAFAINQPNDAIITRVPYYTIPYQFERNVWYYVTWRRSRGVSNFFVNSLQIGGDYTGSQSARPLISDAENTMIGRETYAGGYFNLNGKIKNVKIYNRPLSNTEINKNYQTLLSRVG